MRKLGLFDIFKSKSKLVVENKISEDNAYYFRDGVSRKKNDNDKLYDKYVELGAKYEKEYDFEKALEMYTRAFSACETETPIYCRLAQIHSKMGNLDLSISILEQGKNSSYYTPKKIKSHFETYIDDTFKKVIDNYLSEYQSKKEKGYVYKPRKK